MRVGSRFENHTRFGSKGHDQEPRSKGGGWKGKNQLISNVTREGGGLKKPKILWTSYKYLYCP